MTTIQDLAKLIHLEKIASVPVKPETSHREVWIILQAENLRRIVKSLHQEVLGKREAELIKVRGDVLTEGVVHVKPVAGDLGHVDAPVDEDLLCVGPDLLRARAGNRETLLTSIAL